MSTNVNSDEGLLNVLPENHKLFVVDSETKETIGTLDDARFAFCFYIALYNNNECFTNYLLEKTQKRHSIGFTS